MTQLVSRAIYFNNYDLDAIDGVTITGVDPHAPASRTLSVNRIANADGVAVSGSYAAEKRINVVGYIAQPSKAAFEQVMDQLMRRVRFANQTLRIPQSGSTRDYTASYEALEVSDQTGGYGKFTVTFLCSDPRGYATTYTNLINQANLTTNNKSYAITPTGNCDQAPHITITIDAVTGGTGAMTFANNSRGEIITIERTWTALEALVIDAETGEVTLDGDPVEYSGNIPLLTHEAPNSIVYDDDFTTRQVDIVMKYRPRYE